MGYGNSDSGRDDGDVPLSIVMEVEYDESLVEALKTAMSDKKGFAEESEMGEGDKNGSEISVANQFDDSISIQRNVRQQTSRVDPVVPLTKR